MEKYAKNKPTILCVAIFSLCLFTRFIEYFIIRTDKIFIGENLLHKVVGIVLLQFVLKNTGLKWTDIGFQKNRFAADFFRGLSLGSACFFISYCVELLIFAAQDIPAHLEFYVSAFSLIGTQVKNTNFLFLLLCVLFNIVNVWMEEGIFRGLFIKILSDKKSFMRSNCFAAALFGIWHIVMPIRSYIDGEMTFAAMLFMGVGYCILSGIMGIKWGVLYQMTGNVWVGLGDHLLNNTVATNMLHVVSANGADELQIVRIILAQFISFVLVLGIFRQGRKLRS